MDRLGWAVALSWAEPHFRIGYDRTPTTITRLSADLLVEHHQALVIPSEPN
jgi:hypothetical protein